MFGPSNSPPQQFHVSIRALVFGDIESITPILREHVRNRDTGELIETEVQNIIGYMRGNLDEEGRVRKFYVATDEFSNILGCMAISTPDIDMAIHFSTNAIESAELLNAFVTTELFRGKGIGRKLFDEVCDIARLGGAQYLLVNSGPRYQDSWGFYDKVCDETYGFISNKYGEGRDAKTWRKNLG